jgi:hypothetical protein
VSKQGKRIKQIEKVVKGLAIAHVQGQTAAHTRALEAEQKANETAAKQAEAEAARQRENDPAAVRQRLRDEYRALVARGDMMGAARFANTHERALFDEPGAPR